MTHVVAFAGNDPRAEKSSRALHAKARTAAAAALDDALQQDASKAPYALKRLLGGLASVSMSDGPHGATLVSWPVSYTHLTLPTKA